MGAPLRGHLHAAVCLCLCVMHGPYLLHTCAAFSRNIFAMIIMIITVIMMIVIFTTICSVDWHGRRIQLWRRKRQKMYAGQGAAC